MKIITFISLLLFAPLLFAQTTYVPDDDFEQKLIDLGYDDVLDDYVLTANIEGVITLDISYNGNASDLTGIEDFTALMILDCSTNQLTQLDISQNLLLTELYCGGNELTQLDVSQNTLLTYLSCSGNPLVQLDVSQNTALSVLRCSATQLSQIDISQNPVLTILFCSDNQFTQLDLSQNTMLSRLYCYENQLNQLDLTHNASLDYLHCYDNQLTQLDVSQNTVLTQLICYDNLLTQIDISHNLVLTHLHCNNNQLTQLDVSQNTALISIRCSSNQLTELGVSQNTNLSYLTCRANQLTQLDVTQNTNLTWLHCHNNQLTELDVTQNIALKYFYCNDNQLSLLDMRSGNNTNILSAYFRADNNPELTCIFVDDSEYSTENWLNIDPASTFVETQTECDALDYTYVPDDNFEQELIDLGYDDVLDDYVLTASIIGVISLDISDRNISDLTGIEDFTALTVLFCHLNQLTTLDISQNTALNILYCNFNQLNNLDVSQNINLEVLNCTNNQLNTLDVSQNPALTDLICSNNQLNTLDVRNGNNTNFFGFYADNNPNLTCIFVDDAEYMEENWGNHIDPASTFVETQAECDALGVDEVFLSENLQVYPNPVTNQLFINNSNNLIIQSIKFYDILGKIVIQKHYNFQLIDVSSLQSGVYLAKIETNRGVLCKKVVKE